MPQIRFTMQDVTATLHWGDQFLSQIFHISSMDANWRVKLRIFLNHLHNSTTKSHSKKRWKEDSSFLLQLEHIDGRAHPLDVRLSLVGILLCINLQQRRDLEGGMSLCHTFFAQWTFWKLADLNKKASFRVKSPDELLFQTSLSSLISLGRSNLPHKRCHIGKCLLNYGRDFPLAPSYKVSYFSSKKRKNMRRNIHSVG